MGAGEDLPACKTVQPKDTKELWEDIKISTETSVLWYGCCTVAKIYSVVVECFELDLASLNLFTSVRYFWGTKSVSDILQNSSQNTRNYFDSTN